MNLFWYLLGVVCGIAAFAPLSRANQRLIELEVTTNILIDTCNDLTDRITELEPRNLALTA